MLLSSDLDIISKFIERDFFPRESFPKSRIYLTQNDSLVFEFALAGFKKEDLNVVVEDVNLKVSGKSQKFDESKTKKVFFNNLSSRDFYLTYLIPSNFIGGKINATFENSILRIEIFKPKENEAKNVLIE